MARKGSGWGSVAPLSLRGIYGGTRLEEIKRKYQTDIDVALSKAVASGDDASKVAALRANAIRRAAETDYQVMIREFRREVSNLRKSGLLPKEIKATGAKPTVGLLRRIENAIGVARGEERAVKVTKREAKALREKYPDVRVSKGRVILSPEFKVRGKGEAIELVTDSEGFITQRRLYLTKDPKELEAQVKRIFAGLKSDEIVAMRLGEFNLSRRLFMPEMAKEFLAKLLAYQRVENEKTEEGKYGLRYLTVVKVRESQTDRWLAEHTRERLSVQSGDSRTRAKERKQAKRARQRAARPHQMGAHIRTPEFPSM